MGHGRWRLGSPVGRSQGRDLFRGGFAGRQNTRDWQLRSEDQALEHRDWRRSQTPFRPQRRGVWPHVPTRRQNSRQRKRGPHDQALGRGDRRTARQPELSGVEPRGIQRGRTVRIKLLGSKLADVSAVKSHDPRVTAEIADDAEAAPNQVWVNVTTPNDLPRGAYELWLANPNGE